MSTNRRAAPIRARRSARTARHCALLLAAWLLLVLTPAAAAPDQPIPESKQLPIFLKLLTYDRTLWDRPDPRLRIGILHRVGDAGSRANLASMVESLSAVANKTVNNAPFDFTTIHWTSGEDLAQALGSADIDVLYVTRGHGDMLEVITRHSRERGILTLAGDRDMVSRGLSVGIGLKDGRARIEVNLGAVEAERHELDSRVLRLCKVVDR